MFSVALIGADGSGKTTIARRLASSFPLPLKYVYMGVSHRSSNVMLPTTRLAQRVKARTGRVRARGGGDAHARAWAGGPRGGAVRAWLRLGLRASEAWYRATLAWYYRRRGYITLFDRHYAFDFALTEEELRSRPAGDRVHAWLLTRLYPAPDVVILLDAPAEVLHARKAEDPVPVLEEKRRRLLREAARRPEVVRIDATLPVDEVYARVARQVASFAAGRAPYSLSAKILAPPSSETHGDG